MDIMENIKSKLRTVLDRENLSPSQFGKLMNIGSQTVNNWIKRGVPHGRAFEVAAKLKVPLSEIAQKPIEEYITIIETDHKSKSKTAREFIDKTLDELSGMPGTELYKLSGIIDMLATQWKEENNKGNK